MTRFPSVDDPMTAAPISEASLKQALAMQEGWGRKPTAAHPLCTCREHDHQLDHCLGPDMTYVRPDGTEYQPSCRILGGVAPAIRDACPMHGKQR